MTVAALIIVATPTHIKAGAKRRLFAKVGSASVNDDPDLAEDEAELVEIILALDAEGVAAAA